MFRFDVAKTNALDAHGGEAIELDPTQAQLLRDLAAVVGPRIGLDTIPCHGLWLRAVRNWQIRHGKPTSAVTKMNPAARVQAATQIRDLFVEAASELLRAPEQHAALERAILEAFELYMKKYNKRPA